jgi:transcription initiation factor TFIIE subunit alpha
LAASAAPSTQHTPPPPSTTGEFSSLGDDFFDEDRKPNIEYLDSLNEHNKRSRSVEDEGDAERKQARVGLLADGQGQENGGEHLPMNGVEGGSVDAGDVSVLAEDDPIIYGLFFCFSLQVPISKAQNSVDGKPMPLSQVGEEHHDLMTADEYVAYFEIFSARSA